jgi:predicted transcriptional regulator
MFVAKKKVGVYLEDSLAERLDRVSDRFDGQKSEVVAAAVLMFIEATDDARREALKAVMLDKVDRFFIGKSITGRAARDGPPPVRVGVSATLAGAPSVLREQPQPPPASPSGKSKR